MVRLKERGNAKMPFQRLIAVSLGWVCLIIGFLTFWLPLPTGIILMGVGLALLLSSSPRAVRTVRFLRQKFPRFDHLLDKAQEIVPGPLRRSLAKTRTQRQAELQDGQEDDAAMDSKNLPNPANDQTDDTAGLRNKAHGE